MWRIIELKVRRNVTKSERNAKELISGMEMAIVKIGAIGIDVAAEIGVEIGAKTDVKTISFLAILRQVKQYLRYRTIPAITR